jgi:hypothetical protein
VKCSRHILIEVIAFNVALNQSESSKVFSLLEMSMITFGKTGLNHGTNLFMQFIRNHPRFFKITIEVVLYVKRIIHIIYPVFSVITHLKFVAFTRKIDLICYEMIDYDCLQHRMTLLVFQKCIPLFSVNLGTVLCVD